MKSRGVEREKNGPDRKKKKRHMARKNGTAPHPRKGTPLSRGTNPRPH